MPPSSEATAARRPRHLRGIILAVAVAAAAGIVTYFLLTRPDLATTQVGPTDGPPRDGKYELGTAPPWFRDVTADSGVSITYRNGEEADQFTILESLGGGVALIDYDGDGLLDLFVTGGGGFDGPDKQQIKGRPCKLYKNLGGWKFKDVTTQALVRARPWWYTHGVAVADYDCDGWPDLLVTGYGELALFHNEPDGQGGRRLVDVTAQLGLRGTGWNTGAGWADLDGDGYPDLYVCRYTDWSFSNNPSCVGQRPGVPRDLCSPHRFKAQQHALYRNERGRSFLDVSAEHGFAAESRGLGVVLADLSGNGRPDIYVANDVTGNLLFVNRGGKLHEKAIAAGVALDDAARAAGSMGVDVGDYDGSGRASIFVTNFEKEVHSLYRNLGQELFYYQSPAAGLAALSRDYVGWGTGFIDVDNDGWEDLVIANGHVYRYPASGLVKQPTLFMHNVDQQGRRVFRNASQRGGAFFQTPIAGRGLAIGDLDNDGWPDLVISINNNPVVLLRNEAAATAPKSHWLGVTLVGRGNRDVVGSTVVVEGSHRKFTRFAKGGGSYLSASDRRLLFGLGAVDTVQRVTVRWAWGETQSWEHLEPNHYYELHEGHPTAKQTHQ